MDRPRALDYDFVIELGFEVRVKLSDVYDKWGNVEKHFNVYMTLPSGEALDVSSLLDDVNRKELMWHIERYGERPREYDDGN